MNHLRVIPFILVLGLSLVCGNVFAQTIKVADATSRQTIPGALVTLTSASGNVRNGVTNENGEISFVPLAEQQHLLVRMTGFASWKDSLQSNALSVSVYLMTKTDSLGEVVVTAQYGETNTDNTVQPVRVIDRSRIDAQGAQNLGDVLSTELNIRRSQDQVLGSSMSMQGLSGENVKILVDGVPMIGRLNGNIDLSQINLNNVERIEIVEGPLSVNYGTNALAGAVNLITKKSQGNTFSVQSDSYYESSGHYNFTGRVGGRHKNLVTSFAGGRNFFDGWSSTHKPFYVDWQPIADSTRFDQWKPREQVFGSLYVCRFYQRGSVGLMVDVFDEKITNRGLPRSPYGENAFDDFYFTRRASASLNWKHRFNDNIGLQVIGAASNFRRIKNTFFRDLTTLEDQLVEGTGLQDTSGFALYMLRASITRGGDSLRFRFESGLDLNTETTSGQRIVGQTQWIGDYALFTTAEYRPWEKLVVRGGLRYAINTAYKSPVIPSVHIRADLNDHFFIRASYASGFRAPTLKELYFYFVDINHNIRGNENLRAESSDNFIASFNWQKKNEKYKITLSVSGFYNDIHNLISLALVQGTEYTYVNIGRYKTTGGGFDANFRNEYVRLNAGFSYTGRYNFLYEEFSLPQFTWSPEARVSATWVPGWHDLAFAVFYKYTGVTPGFIVDENNTVYNTSMRDYHTADATVSKKWLNGKLVTEAGVRNIANVQNIQSTIDAGSGHSGSAGSMSVGTGRQYFFSVRWSLSWDKKTE